MPTTSSIGTAGGRNYTTIASWLAAFAPGGWIGQCYNDSEFLITSTINFSGQATSGTDNIILTTGPGQSFGDNAGAQTNALVYNAANGVGIRCATIYQDTINVAEGNCFFSKLQIDSNTGTNNNAFIENAGVTSGSLERCIIQNTGNIGRPTVTVRGVSLINCLVIQKDNNNPGIEVAYISGSPVFANCTIVSPSSTSNSSSGIFIAGSGTVKMENCAVFGFTFFTNSIGILTGSNNASDQTIPFGTSNQPSKSYANQFVSTTGDWRLKAGADCVDNGATDTTDVPNANDIVGTSRPQGSAWDIGCWELVQAAAGAKGGTLPMMGV